MTNKIEAIIYKLNEAYGASTPADNKFETFVNSIGWDEIFEADGEKYYLLDDLTLTIENIDPFEQKWKPSVMVGTFSRELGW